MPDAGMTQAAIAPCTTGTNVDVTGDITTNTTWCAQDTYFLKQKIFVTNNAVLTVQPGTKVLGEASSALLVTRGARLVAEGSANAPIVFSSANPEGTRTAGDWGGVVLLGSARLNEGTCVNDGDPNTAACDMPGYLEGRIEGIAVDNPNGKYGGTDDTSDCGSLKYVRIEFAGEEFSPNNELNGLTLGACGSNTKVSYVQVHRGKDDAIELFGGTASLDHIVTSGAIDDNLDCDLGWRGTVQFFVVHQFAGIGDNGIECDNNGLAMNSQPRTKPQIWNMTLIGTPTTRGMVLREGVAGLLHNMLITGFGKGPVDVRDTATTALWPTDLTLEDSYFWGNGAYAAETLGTAADNDGGFVEQTMIEDAARNNKKDVDPKMADNTATATTGATPNYTPGVNLPAATPPAGFDTSANYAGAIKPGGTDWTKGWTSFPVN